MFSAPTWLQRLRPICPIEGICFFVSAPTWLQLLSTQHASCHAMQQHPALRFSEVSMVCFLNTWIHVYYPYVQGMAVSMRFGGISYNQSYTSWPSWPAIPWMGSFTKEDLWRCSLPWLIFQLLVDVSNCTLMSSTSSPSHPSLLGDAALQRLGQRPHAVDHPHSLLRRQHRAAGRARSLAALLGKVCNTLCTKM